VAEQPREVDPNETPLVMIVPPQEGLAGPQAAAWSSSSVDIEHFAVHLIVNVVGQILLGDYIDVSTEANGSTGGGG